MANFVITERYSCQYRDCDHEGTVQVNWDDQDPIYVCEDCYNKMENKTGYCSMDCQLGYGCDGSC